MALNINVLNCPACGAALNPDAGFEQNFCQFCGARLVITNENEQIYRRIDEAAIKRAETDRIVQIKQLEIDQQQAELDRMIRLRELELEKQRIKNEQQLEIKRLSSEQKNNTGLVSAIVWMLVGAVLMAIVPGFGFIPLAVGVIKFLRKIKHIFF